MTVYLYQTNISSALGHARQVRQQLQGFSPSAKSVLVAVDLAEVPN